jgi:bifunctional DNA-binding transcriptional regulator/antitoxin component of YhaV-PrlF toxin-antitoxin module
MTTTISVTAGGQLVLPKKFCQRKKIKPGSSVRVTEVGDGFYVTPVPEPNEQELATVLAAAGSLRHVQTAAEEAMVDRIVAEVRSGKRRRKV